MRLHPELAMVPVLIFSTYFGGNREDEATAIHTDTAGSTYLAGETDSRDLTATPIGSVRPSLALNNGYLTKFKPKGNEVEWSLLIGGDAGTRINAMTTAPDGSLWITGRTGAKNFTLVNPIQDKHNGVNIPFLMKISPEGKVLFSTYFGGDRHDEANAIAADSKGNVFVAGRAGSSVNFPVKNPLQSKSGGGNYDAFYAKFTAEGKLEFSSYFGGAGADEILAAAVGPDDSLFIAGETYSANLATPNAWQPKTTNTSGFAAKIAPAGDAIVYSTYIGGRVGYTRAQAIAVDAAGRAYVTGYTNVKDFPTTERAIQPKYAGGFRDAFLLQLSPDGDRPLYLTYLGGSHSGQSDPDETARAVRVDQFGHVYVAGETASPDFPVARAIQGSHSGAQDAYLARIDIENGRLIHSSFWGGTKRDLVTSIALGPGGNATIAGQTWSSDLKLENPLRNTLASLDDTFVTRICDPWVWTSSRELNFDASALDPQEFRVSTGCDVKVLIEADAPWVVATLEEGVVKVRVAADGLAPGEHRAAIAVKVAEAANSPYAVNIVLRVPEQQ